MNTTATSPHLAEIDERECWELLSTRPVGRLVWNGSDGLTAVPVNYRTGPDEVVVRTSAYSTMARECDDSPVTFQVDQIDPMTRSGWSVLVRGVAHFEVTGSDPDDVDVWPAGHRPVQVRIEASHVSGRRLPAQG